MVSLFERLDEKRAPPPETMIKQPRRSADRRAFLLDVLANGPVPATIVEERGAAHGFTHKQLRCARQQMSIVAIKEVGKTHGRWLWRLGGWAGIPAHEDAQDATKRPKTPKTAFPKI